MNVRAKYIGLQTWGKKNAYTMNVFGDYACFFLSLCSIADEYNESYHNNYRVDILCALKMALDNDWIDKEYTVKNPTAILEYLTGAKWSKETVTTLPSYIPDNTYTIAVYYNPKTNFTHFRRRWGDTLIDSKTVKEGKIKEYRIFIHK